MSQKTQGFSIFKMFSSSDCICHFVQFTFSIIVLRNSINSFIFIWRLFAYQIKSSGRLHVRIVLVIKNL